MHCYDSITQWTSPLCLFSWLLYINSAGAIRTFWACPYSAGWQGPMLCPHWSPEIPDTHCQSKVSAFTSWTERSILRGVYSRTRKCACNVVPGVAQLLQTELAGHGGLSIFRRLNASMQPPEILSVLTLRVVGNEQCGLACSSHGGSLIQAV